MDKKLMLLSFIVVRERGSIFRSFLVHFLVMQFQVWCSGVYQLCFDTRSARERQPFASIRVHSRFLIAVLPAPTHHATEWATIAGQR
jgi:galactitol-specific phosphotransferase system IIC component